MRSIPHQGLYKQVLKTVALQQKTHYYVRVKTPVHLSRDEFDSQEFIRLYGTSTQSWMGCRHLVKHRNIPCSALPS